MHDGHGLRVRTRVRAGAHVVLLNRASARAAAAEANLRAEVPDATLAAVACDLTSVASVKEAAGVLVTGLDVLCNNAGVMALAGEATADGYDVQT